LPNINKTVENSKLIVQLLDFVEERKDLTIQEWGFRNKLSIHVQSLLEQQKVYWKQRGNIKWATCGDAGTKLFHANATVRHKQNSITTLRNYSGHDISSHEGKAEILYDEFKKRLGTSDFTSMGVDLNTLIHATEDLSCLESPLTEEEVNSIVASLPSGKSPGPDGFDTGFIKICWTVILSDFRDLCNSFYEGTVCMQSVNGSYITLLPKKLFFCVYE
jgi:hypothetical protein